MAKRDRAYFERRLQRDHPAIYKDLLDGKYASVREASIAAGLQKKRSGFQILKREWEKATPAERKQFVDWLRATTKRKAAPAPLAVLDAHRKLTPAAIARLQEIQDKLGLKLGQLMKLMGLKTRDASLSFARSGSTVRPELELALEKLFVDHARL